MKVIPGAISFIMAALDVESGSFGRGRGLVAYPRRPISDARNFSERFIAGNGQRQAPDPDHSRFHFSTFSLSTNNDENP